MQKESGGSKALKGSFEWRLVDQRCLLCRCTLVVGVCPGRSSITRDKFEELCADVWPRAVRPLQQVLEDTGLRVEDLHAVELVGGGTRVPKIQVPPHAQDPGTSSCPRSRYLLVPASEVPAVDSLLWTPWDC